MVGAPNISIYLRKTDMLTISNEQLSLMTEDYLARKILVFLKKQLPEKCNKPSAVLLASIRSYIKTAKEHDIRTERSIAKWSYLLLLTDGKLLDVSGVKDYLKQPYPSQDKKIDRLMKSLAVAAKLTTT